MNGIDALKSLLHAEHLRTVASRANTCVYEALTPNGPVYARVSTDRTAQDRQYELLKALDGFELAPKLVSRFDLGEQVVLVTHAVPGTRLDIALANASRASRLSLFASAGRALGQLHRAISPAQLRELQFWRIRDKAATDSFSWSLHLRAMVKKWSSRIDPTSADYGQLKVPLAQLITYAIELPEPTELRLLHCDYIGRNILTHSYNTVNGILHFEAARVGDAAYDLAKIVWANMDFTDLEARHKLLDGWEQAYGERVHKQAFLYYVGVQCLAAIAWTDTNPPLEGGDAFRSSAIKALQAAVSEL